LIFRGSVFRKFLLTSVALVAVALGIANILLTRYTAERERSLAQQQMAQSLRLLSSEFVSNPPKDVQLWANRTDEILHSRVTLIDSGGVVLADSRNDPGTMENHRERPEVIAALAGRSGSAVRHSATMDIDFSYRAIPLDVPGRPRIVLRLAVPLTQVAASIAAMQSLIFRASLAAALIAIILAYFIARLFARRIRRIENYAKELVNEDYSKTLLAESDDELGSVARSLRSMAEHFRKMLEMLSQESSLREVILDSMFEGILAVEHSLHVTFFNDAFARAFRIGAPNPGQPVAQIVRDPALHALLSRVIRTRIPARERMSLINAEGRIFDIQAAPLIERGNGGAIATFHDVTELERLERVRRDFVANISHELGTPLAAIQGYAETLRDGALEDVENSRRFLNIIISHSERINRLASDLLMLSEIETERTPAPAERISLLEVAENALHAVAAYAEEHRVLPYLNAAEDVYITAHKRRLERAISNLLLNAINYNRPDGEVRIDVRRTETTGRISVVDNGIGIATQDIPRIFERFYRVDKARSRDTGGTGLGLSIVKHIVESAGGRVLVEANSAEGRASRLYFQLRETIVSSSRFRSFVLVPPAGCCGLFGDFFSLSFCQLFSAGAPTSQAAFSLKICSAR
jgi:two-component system phosphate regulon sensor histidine kinase PhoR